MHLHPRSLAITTGLVLLMLLSLFFSKPALSPAEGSEDSPDPVIDIEPVYLPVLARNYPNFFPPPLEARQEGWLRKWRTSQGDNYCLQVSGTLYYLERERGPAGWLAAVAETEDVPEVELEVHLDRRVAISGTAEYFDPACDFPRLHALQLEVIETAPDGTR